MELHQCSKDEFWTYIIALAAYPTGFYPNGEYISSDFTSDGKNVVGRVSKTSMLEVYEIA